MPKTKRWTFWTWEWREKFTSIQDSTLKWPVAQFERLAKKLGFDLLKTDQSLIGGYFVNPEGDCLVCLPYGTDPKEFYLG